MRATEGRQTCGEHWGRAGTPSPCLGCSGSNFEMRLGGFAVWQEGVRTHLWPARQVAGSVWAEVVVPAAVHTADVLCFNSE